MKVVLVGSEKTGKTKLVKRLKNQNLNKYIPTIGVDVSSVKYNNKEFIVWITAGNEKYGGLRYGYWICADKFIVLDKKEK